MKFAKTLESASHELPQDWRPYLVQYKVLKKSIKNIVKELEQTLSDLDPDIATAAGFSREGSEDSAKSVTSDNSQVSCPAICLSDTDEFIKEGVSSPELGPKPLISIEKAIDYDITKDDTGVHPVLTIKVRKAAHFTLVPDEGVSISDEDNKAQSTEDVQYLQTAQALHTAAINGRNLDLEQEQDRDKKITLHLKEDQAFYDLLMGYIDKIKTFEESRLSQYNSNVTELGSELSLTQIWLMSHKFYVGVGEFTLVQPKKKDLALWREIFRIYLDLDIWCHNENDHRNICATNEGRENLDEFNNQVKKLSLHKKLSSRSRQAFKKFIMLNEELVKIRLFEEMNEEATRKIIKKHDKRTHLVAKEKFPQAVSIDAAFLSKCLMYAIMSNLITVVPQVDDHSCPMCLGLYWRPVRLQCNHIFCSRCLIKASRRKLFDCPVCRSKKSVYNAGIDNIDNSLAKFLKLYFPQEVKAKKSEIKKEIAEEESEALRLILAKRQDDRVCTIM
ncbi:hypothetical protein H4219_001518 [Mycoemilia scoparia]|uniref:SPX domain-containing protein n=1 Tax=Mycoemilia scoparia TaxID=417184 RepID=A0A9W8DRR7_9FUNG|nr:hypothetical protein H4219_001518 [Mycoemilia scoparia]